MKTTHLIMQIARARKQRASKFFDYNDRSQTFLITNHRYYMYTLVEAFYQEIYIPKWKAILKFCFTTS